MDNEKVKAELVKFAQEKRELLEFILKRGRELSTLSQLMASVNDQKEMALIDAKLEMLLEISDFIRNQK